MRGITATLVAVDGGYVGTVVLDGVGYEASAPTAESARAELLEILTRHARQDDVTLRVTAVEPDGSRWPITVHPDGSITGRAAAAGRLRDRRRVLVAAGVGLLITVGAAAATALASQPTPASGAPAGPPLALPSSATPTPSSPTSSPGPTGPVEVEVADPMVRPVMFQGGVLPASAVAGPDRLSEHRAAGYRQTALGAAIAAAQLSARLSPTTGPDVFYPVIDDQMVGDSEDIAAYRQAITAAHNAAARRAGTRRGQPILTPRAAITAWRVSQSEDLSGDVPVELTSSSPGGEMTVWTITMRWDDGDWRIAVPTGATAWTKTTDPDNPGGFTQFYQEEQQ